MAPTITLARNITYVIGGQISLDATFVGGESPTTGEPVTERSTISVIQPSGKWDDAQVLAEVQKKYPSAKVAWLE